MKIQKLVISAVMTTGIVLATVFVLNQFGITRSWVQRAFA